MDNNELLQSIQQILKEDIRTIVREELQTGIRVEIQSVVREELQPIIQRLDRIEHNQNEDIIVLLNVINEKVENCATQEEVAALARIQGEQFLRIEMMRKAN